MLKAIYLVTFVLLLSGCGGSSSDKSSSESTSQTSTISGVISAAANMQFDSDSNDINTPFIDNSLFSNAQTLPNFVTLQGFVTEVPTRTFSSSTFDRRFDRFFSTADAEDIYQVQLQAGQIIQLQVVDYVTSNQSQEAFSGDIDLYLYDQNYEIVGSSFTLNEFEYIQVPDNGNYYIQALAYSGASKYILQISPGSQTNNLNNTQLSESNAMNFEPNQLIVHYKKNAFTAAKASLKTSHKSTSRPALAFMDETNAFNISNMLRTASNELASLNHESYQKLRTIKQLKKLKQQDDVISASLNFIRQKQKIPSDRLYEFQWHYEAMNLPQAWDITTGETNTNPVIVAVVDTGIFSNHEDLKNQLVEGYDFIANDSNSSDNESGIDNNPEDPGDGQELGASSWHGTHVAGTIAAQSDNSIGVAGVSWGAKIMPLRTLGKTGGTSYDIMQAMRFAAGLENDSGTLPSQTADIINLSLGGTGSSEEEAALYQQISDLGIIIVAAAGNDDSATLSYPASYPGVISVSATDFTKGKAPYSNFGTTVDIAAPGGNNAVNFNGDGQPDGVLSTLVDDSSGAKKASYSFYEGTSMATPHVAGMFALMKSVYPDLTSTIAHNLLINGSLTDEAGALGRDNIFGYGNANALKAVQAAQALENGGALPESPPILLASPGNLSFSDTTQAIVTLSNEGDGDPVVLSAVSNNDWLSVSPVSVDTNGLGSYQVTVNNQNLSDGFYLGSIVFTFDNAPALSVRVALNIGDVATTGELATLYAILYDIDKENVFDVVTGVNSAETVLFQFTNVPKGRYEILAGTDIDNDFFICQLGEACAIYPPSSQIDPIDTSNSDLVSIDMTAIILSTFNNINDQGKKESLSISIKPPHTPEIPVSNDKRMWK